MFEQGGSILRVRLAFFVAALAALVVVGPVAAAKSHHAAAPIKVKVKATEFDYTFSKTSVPKGSTVIFTVTNTGAVPHNLVFTSLGKATPMIQPGKSGIVKVVFSKKGRFPYICSVPRHAEQGMAGSFVVK
jgi:plastocyanin